MGWDAHSSAKTYVGKSGRLLFEKRSLGTKFRVAAKRVKEKTGTFDGYLDVGSLDCSACRRMIEKATGEYAYVTTWSVDKVKAMNNNANWDFRYKKGDAWAYWSAREFLEICASNDLSIQFM